MEGKARWELKYLRRFGYDKRYFSFEAGRRCTDGAGIWAVSTPKVCVLVHRGAQAEVPCVSFLLLSLIFYFVRLPCLCNDRLRLGVCKHCALVLLCACVIVVVFASAGQVVVSDC